MTYRCQSAMDLEERRVEFVQLSLCQLSEAAWEVWVVLWPPFVVALGDEVSATQQVAIEL